MGSHLRSLLFQLISGQDILNRLRNALRSGISRFSNEEQDRVKELAVFLKHIGRDTHRYVSGQSIADNELGAVFMNFLTSLSLTQDQRLTRGPAYAIQNVALDSSLWSRVIRNFDDEQERDVIDQLNDWISLLNSLSEVDHVDSSTSDELDKMILRFNQTTSLLEQAIRE